MKRLSQKFQMLLDEVPGSVASEVWSLGATVYSLLAGKSPFELEGADNSASELMSRITRAKPQSIGRPDVPASLEKILRRSMSRDPALRQASVLEFVRELQVVESELGVPQTTVELARDDWALGTISDFEERTQLRPVASALPMSRSQRRRRGQGTAVSEAPASRPVSSGASDARSAPPQPRSLTWLLVTSAGLAIALGVAALAVLVSALGDSDIPTVRDVQATQSAGTVEFSWADPGIEPQDRYQIQVRDGSESFQTATQFVIAASPGETVCITVRVYRQGATGPSSAEKCVDVVDG